MASGLRERMMKKSYLLVVIVTTVFLASCQNPYTGLGKDLDLTGPVVSITSHKNMDYVGPTFTLSGLATDNIGVTEVTARIQSLGKTWVASLSENIWSVNVEDLPDGEYLLEITAKDAVNNASASSITSLTIIVDSNSPSLLITLPELRELTNSTGSGLSDLDVDNFDNLPFFKNQSFQIRGALSEDFKAVSAEVGLYDMSGALVYSRKITEKEKPENVTGSLYNFTITVETSDLDLPTSPLIKAQKNFFQVRTVALDMAGNTEARALSYLCVYPDKDYPWAKVTSNAPEDQVGAGGSISGNVFDDDGVKKVYTRIVPRTTTVLNQDFLNWSTSEFTPTTSSQVIDKSADKPQQYTWSLKVPSHTGAYRIYIRVEDVNGSVSPSYTTLDFLVPDVDVPTVDVDNTLINGMNMKDSPGAPFTIFGTWEDNSGSIESVEVIWKEGSKTLGAAVDTAGGTWTLSSLDFGLLPGAQNFEVVVTDQEGNVGRSRLYLIIDTDVTSPKILSVTSPTSNAGTSDNFTIGAELAIRIEFSEPVTVSGIPTLDLNSGLGRKATYLFGSSTQTLTFSYKILLGDNSSDLDYSSAGALNLEGGFIRDASGNNGDLTLAAPGAPGSLGDAKNLVVDTTPPELPEIVKLNATSFSLSGFNVGDFVEYSWDNNSESTDWTLYPNAPITIPMAGSTKILARVRDLAGNQQSVPATSFITNDTNIAYVLGVSSNNLNGTYKAGTTIDIRVNFSRNVLVTGVPSLKLETGVLDREALYLSGSGSPSLLFRYTVMTGDSTSRLDYVDGNALVLNAGSIHDDRSSGAESAVLTLETPGLANSLGNNKNFIIDTLVPQVIGLNSLSADGYYKAGSVIPLLVNFSEPVMVTLTAGIPTLTLKMDGTDFPVPYSAGSGTSALTFNYTVAAGHNSPRLDAASLDLNGGTLADPAGNNVNLTSLPTDLASGSLKSVKNFIIDTTAPVITQIDNPNLTGIQYFPGFSGGGIYLTLNEAVITPVNPSLVLSTTGEAYFTTSTFDSVTGTASLLFNFTVAAGQNSPDLTITQVRQKITDLAGNECSYVLPPASNLADNEDFVVDTAKPGTPSVNLTGGVINGLNYAKTDLTFTLGGNASDWAASEYSLDNGQNWIVYAGAFGISGEGSYNLVARQKDLAGNYSVSSSPRSFILDKTIPAAPMVQGIVPGTYNTNQVFTVSGESGATFEYSLDGGALWTTGTGTTLISNGAYQVKARQTDRAGNLSPATTALTVSIDRVEPTVENLSSATPDGAYRMNQVISLNLQFSHSVYVTGAPRILLETGTTDRYATFVSGAGSQTLVFNYLIQAGDASADLEVTSQTSSLDLNGGTIKDAVGNNALLGLTSLGSGTSLSGQKNLVVDTLKPTPPSIKDHLGNPLVTGTYNASKQFQVLGAETGGVLEYSVDGGQTWGTYPGIAVTLPGSGILTARHTDGAGNISDSCNNVSITLDAVHPKALSVTSDMANIIYGIGAGPILLKVSFSKPVTVTGNPTLALNTGGEATYNGTGSGTSTLTFAYTPAGPAQNTTDLEYASTGALTLNGGTILDTVGNAAEAGDLVLPTPGALNSLGNNKEIQVDTLTASVTALNITASDGAYKSGASIGFTLVFSEPVSITSGTPDILLNSGAGVKAYYAQGSGTNTFTFNYTVGSNENTLDLSHFSTTSLSGNLVDRAGNPVVLTLPDPALLLAAKAVVVDTQIPTAPDTSGMLLGPHNETKSYILTGESGAQISYSINGGAWIVGTDITLATDGTYLITSKQVDMAGNPSPNSTPVTVTIDKTPPLAPVILGLVNGTYSTDKNFTVAGEPGASFQYTLAYVVGDESALWDGGTWQNYTSDVVLSTPGTYLIRARQKDSAGNVGPSGIQFSIVINKTSPTVSSVTSPTSDGAFNVNKVITVDVNFSTPVYVSGAPTILLETGAADQNASYSTGSGTNKLSFTYIVQTGDTSGDLNYESPGALVLPDFATIKDVWGNEATLALPALGSGSSLAGSKALVVDTTAPTAPGISGVTSGLKNTDQTFTLTGLEGVSGAQYSLDGGGNWTTYGAGVTMSDEIAYNITARQTDAAGNTSGQSATVSLSIDKTNPQAPFISGITAGDKGNVQSFQVSGEPGAGLEYSLNNGSTWIPYSSAVSLNPGLGNETTYNVLARQTDGAGNGPIATGSAITLKVDLKAPVISTYSPLSNAVDVNKSGNIILNFSEPVFRESGNITLKRLYNRFPVVMSVDQRNEYRSKLSGGNLTTFDSSFTLTTNGSTGGIPSTTGVYVLNYALDPTDATLLGIFNSIGYNEIVIPVDSTQVSGSGTSTIVINPANDLPQGIHWYVLIDGTAFRDSVGNTFGGISVNTTYQFASGPVATPILRINKQSGAGTIQPTQTTYKISSETQGASLYFTSTNSTPTTYNPTLPAAPVDPTTASTAYSGAETIGTSVTNAGYIYYVKAIASLSGFTNSAISEEIAFKTILSTNYDAGASRYIWYRGSNNSGGPTTAPGFPIRWEDNQYAYVKCGAVDTAATPDRWYWITWEISVANVGSSPVPAEFKANWADQPADWDGTDNIPGNADDMGPSVYSWESGSNKLIFAGGYNNGTPASFEGWSAHARP